MYCSHYREVDLCRLLVVNYHDQRALGAFILPVKLLKILLAQLEIIKICVLSDSACIVALWQWYPAFLQAISQQNLSSGLSVRLCNTLELWVLSFLVPDERAVSLHCDFVLLAVRNDLALLAPGMKLSRS